MDEAVLHELSLRLGGRFRLTALVQKRLVQLMREGSDVIKKNSGGRPVRLVVEEVAEGRLALVAPEGGPGAPAPEERKGGK
jgi:hypothetical protein